MGKVSKQLHKLDPFKKIDDKEPAIPDNVFFRANQNFLS